MPITLVDEAMAGCVQMQSVVCKTMGAVCTVSKSKPQSGLADQIQSKAGISHACWQTRCGQTEGLGAFTLSSYVYSSSVGRPFKVHSWFATTKAPEPRGQPLVWYKKIMQLVVPRAS